MNGSLRIGQSMDAVEAKVLVASRGVVNCEVGASRHRDVMSGAKQQPIIRQAAAPQIEQEALAVYQHQHWNRLYMPAHYHWYRNGYVARRSTVYRTKTVSMPTPF